MGIEGLAPPQKLSLDRAAAASLRDAILSGALAQGARLTETRLAAQFNMSRGTVRAALQRLVAEGLVTQRPYSGWDVAALSIQDTWELSTLRASLEALAARLGAERIDAEGRRSVERAFDELRIAAEGGSADELVAADMGLHRTLVALSGNRRLGEHYDLIANQVRLYITSSTIVVKNMSTVVERHRDLIEPILNGDAVGAEVAAKAHSMRSGAEIVAFLREQDRPSKNGVTAQEVRTPL
ncbi:GntR family transcriptional regulator [Hansschlegelia zhihuaiae]|uniref:GntR family transcriptional regulator n=1 Tax=Hansschlegelia zhihuaiae TaxID=405005 RepID=A0A4V1KJW7_9HYPH|nr:GntR family transcriptional regulator [Hansschlegelia zhihuaiae]RXF75632.1 GntR family transcriptional regulator [Hansschlegelia zhihuaiae]